MNYTSWGFGVQLGTIRSSDNVLNAGGFLWDAPLTILTNTPFNLGSDGQNGLRNSSVGNRTNHFFTNTTSGANSGAFAFIDSAGSGAPNRSPGVTHTNPNLYVYRSGSASPNDFIRMEHNGTNGLIVSGGTTGILLQPGSGVLAISGGISAADATFSGDIAVNGGDITTTSATATLYNTTATTVNIGNAASTVNLMGATANTQTGIGSLCYVKTGQITTASTAKQEIFRYPSSQFGFNPETFFADLIITANRTIIGTNPNNQITKMLIVSSTGSTINHTEYGNVNTSGNLAVYTAELSSNNVIIYATPNDSLPTAFNVYATLIKGIYGFNTEE